MVLPNKHANEPTKEISKDLWQMRQVCQTEIAGWEKKLEEINAQIKAELGDAFAATVLGTKVVTYRPTAKYATATLIKDMPDLTQHYFHDRVTPVFDMDLFAASHPDIAAKYQVRSLRDVE